MLRWMLFAMTVLPSFTVAAPKPKKAAKPVERPSAPVTEPMAEVREALGDSVVRVISQASRVQAFRVSDSGGLRPDPAKAIAADFVRGIPGKVLEGPTLAAWRSVVYNAASYRFAQDVSKCNLKPHFSVQMLSGLDTVEALISFSCNQVLFITGKPGGRWVPRGTFDVKPARAQLLKLALETLDDAETKRLK
jgi:hypothetical protein